MTINKKIGIFGGTFDPIHNIHLEIANAFVQQFTLDTCFFVPTNISPFKIDSDDILFSNQERAEILKLVTNSNKIFEIEEYEIKQNEISYTYKTIEYFSSKYKDSKLYLLIGSDQVINFQKWKNWEEILSKVILCIVNRKNIKYDKDELTKDLTYLEKEPVFLKFEESDLSSTLIRENIRHSVSIKELVPAPVEEFIKKKFNI